MEALKWIITTLLVLIFGGTGIYVLMNFRAWGLDGFYTFLIIFVLVSFIEGCLKFLFKRMSLDNPEQKK
jgi:hypothetical protein